MQLPPLPKPKTFHRPKINPTASKQLPRPPMASMESPIPESYNMCDSGFITSHNDVMAHPCCSMYQPFIPFYY